MLVITALICIPLMLFVRPIYDGSKAKKAANKPDDDFQDINNVESEGARREREAL